MKFQELSNELSMSVRDPAAKVPGWLPDYLHGDFKASPAFGAGDAKILAAQDIPSVCLCVRHPPGVLLRGCMIFGNKITTSANDLRQTR